MNCTTLTGTIPPAPRDVLQRAVLAWHEARTDNRSTGDELWPALLAGSRSLLDTFTAAGTRYIVAHKNPEKVAVHRARLPRERTVLALALAGPSGKWTAFGLNHRDRTRARYIAPDRRAPESEASTGSGGLVSTELLALLAVEPTNQRGEE